MSISKQLAIAGAAIALPSFVLNYITHGGKLPGPDEVDRLDGAWSLVFMCGAALVLTAILLSRPSPVGRKGRHLLYLESVLIALAAAWSVLLIVDPAIVEDPTPAVAIADACWPLHQAFMLVVGIVAVRAGRWPAPQRYALFGPVIGLSILAVGAAVDSGLLASVGLGLGWFIAGAGTAAATGAANSQGKFAAVATAAR